MPPAFRSLVRALAGSAPTLTALHGLPLVELQDSVPPGLAAFTQLRALSPVPDGGLPASPVSNTAAGGLEELTLAFTYLPAEGFCSREPPLLMGFAAGLQHLRSITLAEYYSWPLGSSRDAAEDEPVRLQLPLRLEVGTACLV